MGCEGDRGDTNYTNKYELHEFVVSTAYGMHQEPQVRACNHEWMAMGHAIFNRIFNGHILRDSKSGAYFTTIENRGTRLEIHVLLLLLLQPQSEEKKQLNALRIEFFLKKTVGSPHLRFYGINGDAQSFSDLYIGKRFKNSHL